MNPETSDRFWSRLLRFIEAGRVVPIVGQDLLTVTGSGEAVTLYRHLAEELASLLNVDPGGLPDGAELDAIARRHRSAGGSLEDVYLGLYEIASKNGDSSAPDSLLKLAEIEPLKLFVSTTFDPLLERAINQVRFGGKERTEVFAYSQHRTVDLPGDQKSTGRPQVFHLLGQLSPLRDEYAVTEEDTLEYLTLLQADTRRPNNLFDELRRQPLLILGCSFPNWLARFFIRCARGERLSLTHGQIVVADRQVREDSVLLEFLESYSEGTTVFQDGGAVEFVDEMHYRWKKKHPTSDSLDLPPAKGPEDGAVFLSYASEDRAAAMSIRDALEKKGIDVWFDRDDLKGGDDYKKIIKDSIKKCSVFVPVLSRNCVSDRRRFLKREWNTALDEAESANAVGEFIVPVVIDDTPHSSLRSEFRDLEMLRLPDGDASPGFVQLIRDRFRTYHRTHQPAP